MLQRGMSWLLLPTFSIQQCLHQAAAAVLQQKCLWPRMFWICNYSTTSSPAHCAMMEICVRKLYKMKKISPILQKFLSSRIKMQKSMQFFFLIHLWQDRIKVHDNLLSQKRHVLFIFKPKLKVKMCKKTKKSVSTKLKVTFKRKAGIS